MSSFVCWVASFAAVVAYADESLEKLVDETYRRLTDEERIAQISGVTAGVLTDENGNFDAKKAAKRLPHGIGHVCQFACNRTDEPESLRKFVADLQEYFVKESSSHIPAICHEEVISGLAARTATTYPQQIGIACTWDAPLLGRKCRETSEAMQAVGATFALSPMADVIVNSNWTRLEEGYGESGYLGAVMGTVFVRGLQGEPKDGRIATAACTKHFLGYGVIGGGHSRSWRDIYEEVIYPHEAMIRVGGAAAVMTSYDQFKGEQAVSSETLIRHLLRGYIGFDGTVVSDYGAVTWGTKGVKDEAEKDTLLKRRAAEAIKAGNDVDLPHGAAYKYALACIEEGLVTREEFEKAVKNSLMLKARLGLLDGERGMGNGEIDLDRPEWRETARKLAEESVVLLKNDGVLPLCGGERGTYPPSEASAEGGSMRGGNGKRIKIALVGPNANSAWAMLGDYTYQCMQAFWRRNPREWDKPHIVTLKEGLERVMGNGESACAEATADERGTVVYERGCGWSNPGDVGVSGGGDPRSEALSLKLVEASDPTDFDAAVKAGSEADVIVCAMGENFTLCGENRQRASIRLAGDQEKLVKAMIATGKPVVLVLFGGRNQVISELVDGCAAILQAWYPGEEGGTAVAEILAGKVNPSGKLAMTYPKTESREPLTFGDGSDTPERTQWPFGHGLSYTTFNYRDAKVERVDDNGAEISFAIDNVGDVAGSEVAQVYITAKGEPVRLRGFARVDLDPGESKRVSVAIPLDLFARWRGEKNGEWVVEPGEYEVRVAASAWDVKANLAVLIEGEARRFARRTSFFSTASETKVDPQRLDVQKLVDEAAAKGGGRAIVPAGLWLTGAIHLRSNVELHLAEGARLVFTENLDDYLPAVRTSWEGVECMGYSPLVYAYGCTNVALTGKGALEAIVTDRWRKWGLARKQNPAHEAAMKTLREWSYAETPVEEREFWKLDGSLMRPPLIQFNRCKGVRIEDVRIRQSPFWTIHLLCSEDCVVRGVDSFADLKNSDGIDIESCRRVLVENCVFEQGDDAVVVKSGINHEGRRRAMPSEEIVIRNCTINDGHAMLSIGSELSGGVKNVLMEDCHAEKTVNKVFFVKSNPERGGFVENVTVRRIKALDVKYEAVSAITDYFWKPGQKTQDGVERATPVKGITLEDIVCDSAKSVYMFRGYPNEPIRDLTLRNICVARTNMPSVNENVEGFVCEGVKE